MRVLHERVTTGLSAPPRLGRTIRVVTRRWIHLKHQPCQRLMRRLVIRLPAPTDFNQVALESLALRQQVAVLRRMVKRVHCFALFWILRAPKQLEEWPRTSGR